MMMTDYHEWTSPSAFFLPFSFLSALLQFIQSSLLIAESVTTFHGHDANKDLRCFPTTHDLSHNKHRATHQLRSMSLLQPSSSQFPFCTEYSVNGQIHNVHLIYKSHIQKLSNNRVFRQLLTNLLKEKITRDKSTFLQYMRITKINQSL